MHETFIVEVAQYHIHLPSLEVIMLVQGKVDASDELGSRYRSRGLLPVMMLSKVRHCRTPELVQTTDAVADPTATALLREVIPIRGVQVTGLDSSRVDGLPFGS